MKGSKVEPFSIRNEDIKILDQMEAKFIEESRKKQISVIDLTHASENLTNFSTTNPFIPFRDHRIYSDEVVSAKINK